MPLALINAHATFQQAVDILLSRFNWRSCLVYLNYIIIWSRSLDDHLTLVGNVLTALRDAGTTLMLRTFVLFRDTVGNLDQSICPRRFKIEHARVKSFAGGENPVVK